MENVKVAKICGFCAGCKFAVETAKKYALGKKPVVLFKEIVHNKSVNKNLENFGISIKQNLDELSPDELVIIRTHGETKQTYKVLNEKKIEFVDCTCKNVKNIHSLVEKHSKEGYKIIIIGKYGKFDQKMHPEISATISWCETDPILIQDDEDVKNFKPLKTEKYYLVCQTTFNFDLARKFAEEIATLCQHAGAGCILNISICNAQKMINMSSRELAKNSDIMFVVGSKNSSNTTELFNDLKEICPTVFVDDISNWEKCLSESGLSFSLDSKIGITAGASTDPIELKILKTKLENFILEEKMKNIHINKHSSIQIDDLFFDPYLISDTNKKANYIFITHPHYDHLSTEDIDKIIQPNTTIISTKDSAETLEKFYPNNKKIYVSPNEKFSLDGFEVETYPAYNLNKSFHPKKNGWVGYKIIKDKITYYIAGDTDKTPELESVKCDVLFVPIGGTYTMTALEASNLTNLISPKIVVPTHYGAIVGDKKDEIVFKQNVNSSVEVKILIQ